MKIIYKYPLRLGSQPLKLPMGAQILDVQMQHGRPVLWALIDKRAEVPFKVPNIHIVGTGMELPDVFGVDYFEYLATVQDGGFVWHVFLESYDSSYQR